jgi:hypothetical protein
MNLITSQNYLDSDIVADKISEEDFEVQVSPAFDYDGGTFQVIIDGHHSYAAAKEAGVTPVIIELTAQDFDAICLLQGGDVEAFLAAADWGEGWIYAETSQPVW